MQKGSLLWLACCAIRRRYNYVLAAGIVALSATGCSKPSVFEFDEQDVSRAHLLSEFSLGHYAIPLPIGRDRGDEGPRRNRVRFDFDLHALVAPEEASHIASNWERHQGKIRDRIIRICRSASIEELQEPELATLKARLTDALQAHLGDRDVRRLLLTEVVVREL
jgi:hypothetical protein